MRNLLDINYTNEWDVDIPDIPLSGATFAQCPIIGKFGRETTTYG